MKQPLTVKQSGDTKEVFFRLQIYKYTEDIIMQKNLTEIVFILDRSGSMSGLESDTVGGFNSMLAKQQREEGEAYISTVLFDDKIEVLHDRKDIKEVKPITEKEYYVRGCTALLDAVGGAIHHIGTIHKYAREEDRPEKTVFVITTDGLENASREYTCEKVKQMIERQREKYNWEFIFLGANMDAVSVAGKMGIAASNAVRYECDSIGTGVNFGVIAKTISKMRSSRSDKEFRACVESGAWKEEIEADFEKRHS